MMEFKTAQDNWSEQLLSQDQFCDAVAVLGATAKRVPFIGALLANISEPLRAALFGEFKEGSDKVITLPDVTLESFRAIMRAAAHLDPQLSAENVVGTLKAAKLYMIESLVTLCTHYIVNIKPEEVLRVMTSAVCLDFNLPQELHEKLWAKIISMPDTIIKSGSFCEAHGSIIARIVDLDELGLKEEDLWSSLVKWSANAVLQPELLGPFGDLSPELSDAKRLKDLNLQTDRNLGPNQLAQQAAMLQSVSQHLRLGAMSKEYFMDHVRPYISREDSDIILAFHLLGRQPSRTVLVSKRSGLQAPEQLFPVVFKSHRASGDVDNLSLGRGTWKPTSSGSSLGIQVQQNICMTKLRLTFAASGLLWTPKCVSTIGSLTTDSEKSNKRETVGRMITMTFDTEIRLPLQLLERDLRIKPTSSPGQTWEGFAQLVNVELFGKKIKEDHALEVAQRHLSDWGITKPS